VVLGLYGKEAPQTVASFLKLIEGQLMAPCIDEDEADPEADDFGVCCVCVCERERERESEGAARRGPL
jgi:hypothetical protein